MISTSPKQNALAGSRRLRFTIVAAAAYIIQAVTTVTTIGGLNTPEQIPAAANTYLSSRTQA